MISRSSSIEKGRIISRRLFILVSAKAALLAGITSRLYNLQISDKEKYEILSLSMTWFLEITSWFAIPFSVI